MLNHEVYQIVVTIMSDKSGNDYTATDMLIAPVQIGGLSAKELVDEVGKVVTEYKERLHDAGARGSVKVYQRYFFEPHLTDVRYVLLDCSNATGRLSEPIAFQDSIREDMDKALGWAKSQEVPF